MATSHTQSRKWVNPEIEKAKADRRLHNALRKFCKSSFCFPSGFDIESHRRDIAAHRQEITRFQLERRIEELSERQRLRNFAAVSTADISIKPAFGGRQFEDNRSAVMALHTVFTPSFEINRLVRFGSYVISEKEVASWPSRAEAKYEGDERISTDPIHRRFLGVPRMAGNETVNWMQRSIISQYAFDDFYPTPNPYSGSRDVEVFIRSHDIDELMVERYNEEGVDLIGKQLSEVLEW